LHERILEIGADDFRVARKGFRVELTRERETGREPLQYADRDHTRAREAFGHREHRRRSDDASDLRVSLTRVGGDHQPSHTVADDDDRKRWSLGAYRRDETLQVVEQMFEATHVAAGAAGSAVAPLVVGVDLESCAGQV
jgi:hypothetical protein